MQFQDVTDTLSTAKKITPLAANGQPAVPIAMTSIAPIPAAPLAAAAVPAAASPPTTVQLPKKRGRKKGSKGVDGRLANLAQKMQSGSQYDTLSLMSLKNQIDSMRGNAKKVKTTKELLAELQNRNTSGATFDGSNSNAIGGGIGSNFGSRTSSPIATSQYQLQQQQLHSKSHPMHNQFVVSPSSCSGKNLNFPMFERHHIYENVKIFYFLFLNLLQKIQNDHNRIQQLICDQRLQRHCQYRRHYHRWQI